MRSGKPRALTLIEVILAMWILFIAICFIFEVLRTSYTYVTKLKIISQLGTLSTSKLEKVCYDNYATSVGWTAFTEDPEYQYSLSIQTVDIFNVCPGYRIYQVDLYTRGPVGRPNIKAYTMSLTTLLVDYQQTITRTHEERWGEGLDPGAELQ